MHPSNYFTSLSDELRAVQDRIRNLIGDAHWPSDGAWKESVLRAVLRRYLPSTYHVASGFVLTPEKVSTQIDILICDDTAPVFFRDGDFVISTAECVRAVIEVKTQLDKRTLRKALCKLDDVATLCRRRATHRRPFVGLFVYEPINNIEHVTSTLPGTCDRANTIHAMCFGGDQYCRYWEKDPEGISKQPYDTWNVYEMPQLATGYFIHNLLEYLFPDSFQRANKLWYPVDGKESRCVAKIPRRKAGDVGFRAE